MPKQADDLTREGDEAQETPKAKLKIPVPKKDEVIGLFGKAARSGKQRAEPSAPPDPGKR
jgi:hypothetical protein